MRQVWNAGRFKEESIVDMVPYRGASSVVLRILSPRIIPLEVHWVGRSLLCAGQGNPPCFACRLGSPKPFYYAIGKAKRGESVTNVGLLEISGDVVSQLVRQQFDVCNPLGWSWQMTKRTDRPGWVVQASEQSPEPHESGESILGAIETLYGLQRFIRDPGEGDSDETVTEWRRSQRDRLQARLEFATTNGSHQLP